MSVPYQIPTYNTTLIKGKDTDRTWYRYWQDLGKYVLTLSTGGGGGGLTNLDGGSAISVYGGVTGIDGGGA
jgi:hypothetical protein